MNNRDEILIVGGGYSLQNFDFNKLKDKTTIAVNKSASYIPNLDYFITMDFTALKKIKSIKNILATKIFVANLSVPYLQEVDGRIVDTRFNLVYKLEDFDIVIKSRNKETFAWQWKNFSHGANSGYCALQLAILLGYKNIYLLGIDLISGKETHFHNGYGESKEGFNKKLEQYYNYFYNSLIILKETITDVNIVSCSPVSKLNNILRYEELKI